MNEIILHMPWVGAITVMDCLGAFVLMVGSLVWTLIVSIRRINADYRIKLAEMEERHAIERVELDMWVAEVKRQCGIDQ